MSFWQQMAFLFQRWQTMADEQLSVSIPTSEPMEPPSDGIQFQPDPDSRPIGRCYYQQMNAMAAVATLKAAQQAVRQAVAEFGDCRAQARAEAGDYAAANNTSFEDAVEAAMLKIAVSASIIEDIVKRACSEYSEDSNE
jgi:hypothetical protein